MNLLGFLRITRCLGAVAMLLGAVVWGGCTATPRMGEMPPGEPSPARDLYIVKCAKCHKFYNPAKYSDADWSKWMDKMSKKSKLTPEQTEMISNYVENTIRHPQPAGQPAKGATP